VASSGRVPPSAANGVAITTAGNVGIGTSTPAIGYRLEVNGATLLRPGNGSIQFGSPNSELGLSIIPNLGNRADLRFDGSVLKLAATSGQAPPSAANGLAITTAGNVGIGTTNPAYGKLHVETAEASKAAIYGNATGASSAGVYGDATTLSSAGVWARNPVGPAIRAEGNAVQTYDKGGFVKAMAYIDPFLPADRYVVRCYNSQPRNGPATSTAPCGIGVTRLGIGHYTIDFGFNVEDRFFSVTPRDGRFVTAAIFAVTGYEVDVAFTVSDNREEAQDARFYIVVY
jgi:hypothetical protein